MKQLYIIILLCAFCANGKTVTTTTIAPNLVTTVNATNIVNITSCPMKLPLDQKPKLMVTFLANAQNKDTTPYNDIEPPPFFLDPFSRMLQYFFASIMSDVNRPFEESDKRNISNELDEIFGVSNPDLDNSKNETNTTSTSCVHGLEGFCPNCHATIKGTNQSVAIEKTENALNSTENSTHPHFLQEIQIFQKPKHKRQYFLSISGDTEKRVTAPIASEHKRAKRNFSNSSPKTEDNRQSFLKILQDTIYGSLNKDENLTTTTEVFFEVQTPDNSAIKKDELNNEANTISNSSTEDDNEEHDLYDFGIYPHEAESSQGWHYFFIVTLPVSCTFALVIFFLCILLRTRGSCCQLFLQDPTKILEQQNKAKKRRKISRKKINVEYT